MVMSSDRNTDRGWAPQRTHPRALHHGGVPSPRVVARARRAAASCAGCGAGRFRSLAAHAVPRAVARGSGVVGSGRRGVHGFEPARGDHDPSAHPPAAHRAAPRVAQHVHASSPRAGGSRRDAAPAAARADALSAAAPALRAPADAAVRAVVHGVPARVSPAARHVHHRLAQLRVHADGHAPGRDALPGASREAVRARRRRRRARAHLRDGGDAGLVGGGVGRARRDGSARQTARVFPARHLRTRRARPVSEAGTNLGRFGGQKPDERPLDARRVLFRGRERVRVGAEARDKKKPRGRRSSLDADHDAGPDRPRRVGTKRTRRAPGARAAALARARGPPVRAGQQHELDPG